MIGNINWYSNIQCDIWYLCDIAISASAKNFPRLGMPTVSRWASAQESVGPDPSNPISTGPQPETSVQLPAVLTVLFWRGFGRSSSDLGKDHSSNNIKHMGNKFDHHWIHWQNKRSESTTKQKKTTSPLDDLGVQAAKSWAFLGPVCRSPVACVEASPLSCHRSRPMPQPRAPGRSWKRLDDRVSLDDLDGSCFLGFEGFFIWITFMLIFLDQIWPNLAFPMRQDDGVFGRKKNLMWPQKLCLLGLRPLWLLLLPFFKHKQLRFSTTSHDNIQLLSFHAQYNMCNTYSTG